MTREHLHFYPEIPDGTASEVWHFEKWRRDMPRHALSPMFDQNGKHYYIDEVARMQNGEYVIPLRWVMSKKVLHADAYLVVIDSQVCQYYMKGLLNTHWIHILLCLSTQGLARIDDSKEIFISSEHLCDNFLDLEDKGDLPNWDRMLFVPCDKIKLNIALRNL
jgi:hypothetical protein